MLDFIVMQMSRFNCERGYFAVLCFRFISLSQIQFRDSFDSDKQSKWLKSILGFEVRILIHFLIDVVFGVALVAS